MEDGIASNVYDLESLQSKQNNRSTDSLEACVKKAFLACL